MKEFKVSCQGTSICVMCLVPSEYEGTNKTEKSFKEQ